MNVAVRPGSNLSPMAASRRLRAAVVMLAITLALAIGLNHADAGVAWRAVLFVPFLVTASAFYQGLFRT